MIIFYELSSILQSYHHPQKMFIYFNQYFLIYQINVLLLRKIYQIFNIMTCSNKKYLNFSIYRNLIIIKMNQIQCQEHEKKIILLCLESHCDSNRVLCQKCIQSHSNHSDQLVDLDDLQMINDQRLQKITQGKEKLQELLETLPNDMNFKRKRSHKIFRSLKESPTKTDATPKPQVTKLPPNVEKQCCIKKLGKRVKKDKWYIGFVVFAIILQLIIQKLCTVNTNPQQFISYQDQNHIVVTSDTLAKPFTFDTIIQNSCKIKITPKNSMFLLGLYQGTQVENFDSRLVYTIHQEQTYEEINRKWTGSQSTYHQQPLYDSHGRKINASYSVIKQEDIYIPTTIRRFKRLFLIIRSSCYKEQFYGFELNSQNRVIETTCMMVIEAA
ncbi:hypothetical protein pb186bvf_006318 [Paramecium bursaria]